MWHHEVRPQRVSCYLKSHVKKGLANRGDHLYARNGNVSVVLWQDTKAICCAATHKNPSHTVNVSRKQKNGTMVTVKCPESIASYNKHMGGVDRNDQLRGYYNTTLKSRKYYKYLFFAAFEITITNTYIASKFFDELKTKTLKDFRLKMANLLIGEYNSRKKRGRPLVFPQMKCFCKSHFPVKADKKGNRCHFCHNFFWKRERRQHGNARIATSTYATLGEMMIVSTSTTHNLDQLCNNVKYSYIAHVL